MADIFSEVEEELRRDKYNVLLRRYGLWIAGAAFLVVLAVAGYELIWTPWQADKVDRASTAYQAALEQQEAGNIEAADAEFEEIIADSHGGYAVLALMQRAAIAADEGDAPRAAALYEQAGDMADESALRNFARIKALYVIADELSYAELLDRAEPMASSDNPFRFSARELIAAGALKEGDYDRAREEYRFLNLAPETPPGVRRRAQEGMAALNRMQPGGSTPNEEQSEE